MTCQRLTRRRGSSPAWLPFTKRSGVASHHGNVDGTTGGPFFSSGRNNLLTGSTSALSFDSLSEAVKQLRLQVDAGEGPIDLAPKTLVVSPAKEVPARQLLSAMLSRDSSLDQEGTSNPLASVVKALEVESRLGVASFTTSPNQWYLFADKSAGPIIVGSWMARSPTIEVADTDFSTLGMQWRCFWDYGCCLATPSCDQGERQLTKLFGCGTRRDRVQCCRRGSSIPVGSFLCAVPACGQ